MPAPRVPLRLVVIASNIAFIRYAWIDGLMSILILHGALLPLNVLRLIQLRRLEHEIESGVCDERCMELLLPLMRCIRIRPAEMLCSQQSVSGGIYYIVEGTLLLADVRRRLAPGFGSEPSRSSLIATNIRFARSPRRNAPR